MTRTIEGGCLCGEVRYRIQGEPLASVTCQCRTCRKASAAAIVPWLHLDAANFAFLAGTPVDFKSSPPVTRTFCGRCGTRVDLLDHEARPGDWLIPAERYVRAAAQRRVVRLGRP